MRFVGNAIAIIFRVILLSTALTATSAQNDCSSIPKVACSLSQFSTFCSLLFLAELDTSLDDDDDETEYTVFVPTNEAFDRIGRDTIDLLTYDTNRKTLEYIVLFHITDVAAIPFSDLNCTELLPMLNGEESRTKCSKSGSDGGVVKFQSGGDNSPRSEPQLVLIDKKACNGIIHAVNNVMMP